MPKRIQRKRTKGWRMPADAVYVGRPSRWGNPYRAEDSHVPEYRSAAVGFYCMWLAGRLTHEGAKPPTREEIVRELRGRDLVCWCPLDQPCHADVLLEIANAEVNDA